VVHTHYELNVDGRLLAILDTGLVDGGGPDHRRGRAEGFSAVVR
jgi:hypothetical protein